MLTSRLPSHTWQYSSDNFPSLILSLLRFAFFHVPLFVFTTTEDTVNLNGILLLQAMVETENSIILVHQFYLIINMEFIVNNNNLSRPTGIVHITTIYAT